MNFTFSNPATQIFCDDNNDLYNIDTGLSNGDTPGDNMVQLHIYLYFMLNSRKLKQNA